MRVHFDKVFSIDTKNLGSHLMGLFCHCVRLACLLPKRLHQLFLPGRKTVCGTQDRAGPRFCNLGPIPCPNNKEQLVLKRLSVVLYGCPSAQGLNWISSQDNEWPGLCSRTCLFQDHRWKPPLQPHTDSPQYGNLSSRKWNRNTKYDLTQYQGAFFFFFSVSNSSG